MSDQLKMTVSEFEHILTRCGVNGNNGRMYAAPLLAAFKKGEIITPLRMGHALAQLLHESAMLHYSAENLNYSANGLRRVFGKYFPTIALANQYSHKPVQIANRVYASRMGNGNEASGDGWKFRGRGPLQVTGKNNYTALNAWMRKVGIAGDVLANPDLLLQPEFGVLGFVWYWSEATGDTLNKIADRGDDVDEITQITRKINGGTNGLQDRINIFSRAMLLIRKAPTYRSDSLPL